MSMVTLLNNFFVLKSMLESFDIPDSRRELTQENLEWMRNDLDRKNGSHEEYWNALKIIEELLDYSGPIPNTFTINSASEEFEQTYTLTMKNAPTDWAEAAEYVEDFINGFLFNHSGARIALWNAEYTEWTGVNESQDPEAVTVSESDDWELESESNDA